MNKLSVHKFSDFGEKSPDHSTQQDCVREDHNVPIVAILAIQYWQCIQSSILATKIVLNFPNLAIHRTSPSHAALPPHQFRQPIQPSHVSQPRPSQHSYVPATPCSPANAPKATHFQSAFVDRPIQPFSPIQPNPAQPPKRDLPARSASPVSSVQALHSRQLRSSILDRPPAPNPRENTTLQQYPAQVGFSFA